MRSPEDTADSTSITRRASLALTASALMAGIQGKAAAAAKDTLTIAVHVSLPPGWLDPSEMPALITTYMLVYALHDALMKPMREGNPAPSLAESHTMSEDGLTYTFVLREGITFHNGDPVTSDDAKFTFERYRGASQKILRDAVASVTTPDARRIVFTLKEPWPDFMTFYTLATGANWILPRKHIEKVGDAGYKKSPEGAGPFKLVSFDPGIELVMEANENYWRRKPAVKRIVMKVIPDEATRLVALKRGEVDYAYSIRGELAEEAKRTPGLKLEVAADGATYWMYFPEQWDARSPWSNPKVRQAAVLAIDYVSINNALSLGASRITSNFIPRHLKFHWPSPAPEHDLPRAVKLLAEAGYPGGFDAGFYWCDSSYANLAEAAINNLAAAGIKLQLRPLERAAFDKGFLDKRYKKGIIQASSAAFGNASTRLSIWAIKDAAYAYGGYPDIDALYPLQLHELDEAKRTAILHKMQQLIHEKNMFVPLWQLGFLRVSGPRVKDSTYGSIPGFVYIGPFEDVTLKES